MKRVLIVGVSTRAAAESAARAGFDVTALDAYADLDQHPSVRALSLPRDFKLHPTAPAGARAARTIESDAVAYLSSFENHPRAVAMLAAGRTLWETRPTFYVVSAIRLSCQTRCGNVDSMCLESGSPPPSATRARAGPGW